MIIIKCKNCGFTLLKGKTLVNAIICYDFNASGEKIDAGIMCTTCGNYILEKRIKEVIEKWRKRKNAYH